METILSIEEALARIKPLAHIAFRENVDEEEEAVEEEKTTR